MYSSPDTPTGTGCSACPARRRCVLAIGRPIGIGAGVLPASREMHGRADRGLGRTVVDCTARPGRRDAGEAPTSSAARLSPPSISSLQRRSSRCAGGEPASCQADITRPARRSRSRRVAAEGFQLRADPARPARDAATSARPWPGPEDSPTEASKPAAAAAAAVAAVDGAQLSPRSEVDQRRGARPSRPWAAGGAGGVDHVGQVVGGRRRRARSDWRRRGSTQARVQAEHDAARRAAHGSTRLLCVSSSGPRRPSMKAEALRRVRRVERHVGAAGLEDAEQADDHLQRALHAQRRPAPRGPTPRRCRWWASWLARAFSSR